MAFWIFQPLVKRADSASSREQLARSETMLIALSLSLEFKGTILFISPLSVLPNFIIEIVLIELSTIFSAVPAFNLVDPLMISSPTSNTMHTSAICVTGDPLVEVIATVLARTPFALFKISTT